MNKKVIIAVVVVVVLGFGFYFYSQSGGSSTKTTTISPVAQTNSTPTPTATPQTFTVHYTKTGFSPKTITIAKGDSVTFVADPNSDEMWVASNPHPTHEGYDGTTKAQHCVAGYTGAPPFDQCSTGTSFTFKFDKVGTWGYHNHGNHSDVGTVIVQ